jgi:hypothetical protein
VSRGPQKTNKKQTSKRDHKQVLKDDRAVAYDRLLCFFVLAVFSFVGRAFRAAEACRGVGKVFLIRRLDGGTLAIVCGGVGDAWPVGTKELSMKLSKTIRPAVITPASGATRATSAPLAPATIPTAAVNMAAIKAGVSGLSGLGLLVARGMKISLNNRVFLKDFSLAAEG